MWYLSGVILAVFLSFILISKKGKTDADYLLSAWLCITGIHLFSFYLFFTGQHLTYPGLVAIGFSLPLVQGPFLYLYTTQQTSPKSFKPKQLLHFIPVVLSYVLFGKFYFMPHSEQVQIFKDSGAAYAAESLINLIAIYISGVVYIALSLTRLLKYRKGLVKQFSNTEKVNFNWLLYLIFWMAAIWIVILFVQEDVFIFGAAVLFVVWIGYFGIKQVNVFSENGHKISPALVLNDASFDNEDESIIEPDSSVKYKNSNLKESDALLIHQQLLQLLQVEQPFTNPDLTLNDLAKSLKVHPNQLSQVINSLEQKNFYDLINEKRVEAFLKLAASGGNKQFTLLALAYDCGFNSKASFNRNFKKFTGQTPSEYLKIPS
jgi:AraC-like DNA-binding protein